MDEQPHILALAMIATSLAYFILDRRENNLWNRLFVSAHGLTAASLYFFAISVWSTTAAYRPWAGWPFAAMYLLPVASMAFALARFRGPRLLHISLAPMALCMFYTYAVGAMAVTGDWL
jgi:hypothetical protein